MFTTTARSEPINPTSRSEHVGISVSRGGQVVVGSYFTIDPSNPLPPGQTAQTPEMSKFLLVTGEGVIVYQYFDGNYDFWPNALPGVLIPINAVRVVTSHTFTNGGAQTTTATGIHWYGGV
jgi:hypothetical protein